MGSETYVSNKFLRAAGKSFIYDLLSKLLQKSSLVHHFLILHCTIIKLASNKMVMCLSINQIHLSLCSSTDFIICFTALKPMTTVDKPLEINDSSRTSGTVLKVQFLMLEDNFFLER